jgi:GT2 family glycosyltransferase
VLVYNGQDVVPRCLESIAPLVSSRVEVVVFDDCSPRTGWSDEVSAMCASLGLGYYRSPRNLGIPRNMSLVMRTAVDAGVDVVGLVNSDVVMPRNFVEVMDAAFESDSTIASVTPWSNNVSAFSLPMADAHPTLLEADAVSAMSEALRAASTDRTLDIPTGVGYCLMLDVEAVREIGTMDPIFGRGYCEEVDWCQRARAVGRRNVLSLGSFVFHAGSGTNRDEGLLAHGFTTVPEHEMIILERYPDYRRLVDEFFDQVELEQIGRDALSQSLKHLLTTTPFDLIVGDVAWTANREDTCALVLGANEGATVTIHGLSGYLPTEFRAPAKIEHDLGLPQRVLVLEPGALGRSLAAWARDRGIPVKEHVAYPTRA